MISSKLNFYLTLKKKKNNIYQDILINLKIILSNITKFSILLSINSILEYFIIINSLMKKQILEFFSRVIFFDFINNLTKSFLDSFTDTKLIKYKTKKNTVNTYNNLINIKLQKQLLLINNFKNIFIYIILFITITFIVLINYMNIKLNILIKLIKILYPINSNNLKYDINIKNVIKIIIFIVLKIYNDIKKHFLYKYGIFSFYYIHILKNIFLIINRCFFKNSIIKDLINFYLITEGINFIIFQKYKMKINLIKKNVQKKIIKSFNLKSAIKNSLLVFIINNSDIFINKFLTLNLLKISNEISKTYIFFIMFTRLLNIEDRILSSIKTILKFHIRSIYYINKNIINNISLTSLLLINIKFNILITFIYNNFLIFFINNKNIKEIIILIMINILKIIINKYYFNDLFLEIKKKFSDILLSKIINYIILMIIIIYNQNQNFILKYSLINNLLSFLFKSNNQQQSYSKLIELYYFFYLIKILIKQTERFIIQNILINNTKILTIKKNKLKKYTNNFNRQYNKNIFLNLFLYLIIIFFKYYYFVNIIYLILLLFNIILTYNQYVYIKKL